MAGSSAVPLTLGTRSGPGPAGKGWGVRAAQGGQSQGAWKPVRIFPRQGAGETVVIVGTRVVGFPNHGLLKEEVFPSRETT